jgi:D-alanyl-D-alanine carboxypeptidase
MVAVLAILITGLMGCDESAAQPAERDVKLGETIPRGMQQASIPGAIVGVWQDGAAPYVRAFGVRDTASGEPMATNLYMRIGSLTKTFTVTAVLQLVDQGKLGLDDPIGKYVLGVPDGGAITIRQLAAMRSGLYNYTDEVTPTLASAPQRQWRPEELLAISFRHPPRFPAGTEFDYSNTNTVLLGLVVEKVSGQSLNTYIDERIARAENLAHGLLA